MKNKVIFLALKTKNILTEENKSIFKKKRKYVPNELLLSLCSGLDKNLFLTAISSEIIIAPPNMGSIDLAVKYLNKNFSSKDIDLYPSSLTSSSLPEYYDKLTENLELFEKKFKYLTFFLNGLLYITENSEMQLSSGVGLDRPDSKQTELLNDLNVWAMNIVNGKYDGGKDIFLWNDFSSIMVKHNIIGSSYEQKISALQENLSEAEDLGPQKIYYNFLMNLQNSFVFIKSLKAYQNLNLCFSKALYFNSSFDFPLTKSNQDKANQLANYIFLNSYLNPLNDKIIFPTYGSEMQYKDLAENIELIHSTDPKQFKVLVNSFFKSLSKEDKNEIKTSLLVRKQTELENIIYVGLSLLTDPSLVGELSDAGKTKISFAKKFIDFLKSFPPSKQNLTKFQNTKITQFLNVELIKQKTKFIDFLRKFPMRDWASQERIDLYSKYFLNNPVSFMDFYSVHLNNLMKSKIERNFGLSLNIMKNFYEEYTGLPAPTLKLVFFKSLSQFLSNQENEKLENDNDLKQMQKHFNELKQELFITPLTFKILQEKFNIYLSKQNKEKIYNYLKNSQYIEIYGWLEQNKKITNALEVKKFLNMLQEIKPSSSIVADNQFLKNSKFAVDLSPAQFSKSIYGVQTIDYEKWNIYLADLFERDANFFLQNIFNQITTEKDSKNVLNLMSAYIELSQVYNNISERINDIIYEEVIPDKNKTILLIEARRAFSASSAYYLNKNDLFNPGKYKYKKHDCYDFVSAITIMSDLGFIFSSPKEFEDVFLLITMRNTKHLIGFQDSLTRTINNLSEADSRKKLLTSMQKYFSGDYTTIKFSRIVVNDSKFAFGKSDIYKTVTMNLVSTPKQSLAGRVLVIDYSHNNSNIASNIYTNEDFKLKTYVYQKGASSEAAITGQPKKDLEHSLLGKWIFFDKTSPYTRGKSHHGLFTYDVNNNLIMVDFCNSKKISALSWSKLGKKIINKYSYLYDKGLSQRTWNIIWKPNAKLKLRLTCPNLDLTNLPGISNDSVTFIYPVLSTTGNTNK